MAFWDMIAAEHGLYAMERGAPKERRRQAEGGGDLKLGKLFPGSWLGWAGRTVQVSKAQAWSQVPALSLTCQVTLGWSSIPFSLLTCELGVVIVPIS